MTALAYALLAAATSIVPGAATTAASDSDGQQFAQLTIQQRIVIRIPTTAPPPDRHLRWKEKNGPKCVQIDTLAGAVVAGPETVDLFQRGGARFRAQLDRQCDQVDLGYGFYIRPTADGRICADRDTIHARTGGACGIERFRALVPQR